MELESDYHMKLIPLPVMVLWLALTAATPAPAASSLELARRLNEAFVEVAEKVSPTVVVITVQTKPNAAALESEDNPEAEPRVPEFWRDFHEQFRSGQGSGVLIREDGYILSNRHVIEDAEKIEVRLQDGRTFPATVRGVDRQSDVAVLKIEARGLPVATLADSAKTRVGEFAIAVGAPFGLDYSVTFGHVSAKSRSNILPMFGPGAMMDEDFIQTDANINPGNSGGPLVNLDGEVIGINTLIHGLRTGIGFAIPSSLAREVADQIVATGRFARPWLGVSLLPLRDAPDFNERSKRIKDGVIIRGILPRGPAAESELRAGDVVTHVEGKPVNSVQGLRNEIRGKKIGQPVLLKVVRDDKPLTVRVKLGEYVEPAPVVAAGPRAGGVRARELGLSVRPISTELANQFKVAETEGVIIVSVEEEGPADKCNLKPGDVIISVNDQNIRSAAQFREALQDANLKAGVRISIKNKAGDRTETLKATK